MIDIFEITDKRNNVIFTGLKNGFFLRKQNINVVTLVSKDSKFNYPIKFRDIGFLSPEHAIRELNKIIYKSETEGTTVTDLLASNEFENKINTQMTEYADIVLDGYFLEPFVSKIENGFLNPNSNENITIIGSHFCPRTTVDVVGQRVISINYVNPNTLIVNLSVDDKIGTFDVKIINKRLEFITPDGIEVGVRTEAIVGWKMESSKILIEGTKISRTQAYGWNQGAISDKGISYSNGYLEISPVYNTNIRHNRYMVGLSYTNSGYGYRDIEYALYFNNRSVYVYHKGSNKSNIGTWVDGDTFKIVLEDKKIIFKKNNIYVYHIDIEEVFFPLFADCTIYDANAYIENLKLFGKLVNI